MIPCFVTSLTQLNRTFWSCPQPLFQSEATCEATDMKRIFYSLEKKTHFHKKGFTLWNSEMAYTTKFKKSVILTSDSSFQSPVPITLGSGSEIKF